MSEQTPGDERRHFTRIPIDSRAVITCNGQRHDSHLLDISLKGALLERPKGYRMERGQHCTLEMMLEPQEIIITMEGSVVHMTENHIGFRCDHIDLESISHLKRLVELNLGSEAALERELCELTSTD